jgi:MFS family permease
MSWGGWQYRHTVLSLCLFAYFATRVGQLSVSPLIPAITDSFDITAGVIGTALTGMWAAYALTQLPSGLLSARYGERRVITATLLLACACTALMVFAPSVPFLFVSVILLGGSVGLYYNTGTSLLVRQFDDFDQALGIHRVGGPLAGLITPLLVGTVNIYYGWRPSLSFAVITPLLIAVLFSWRVDRTPPILSGTTTWGTNRYERIAELLTRPDMRFFTVVAGLANFVELSSLTFLLTFLISFHDVRADYANVLFSVYFVVSGTANPLAGWLSTRWSYDETMLLVVFVALTGYGILLTATGPLLVVGVVFAGVVTAWNVPVQAAVMETLDRSERGRGFGIFRASYILLGSTGSAVTGTIADVANWPVAYATLGAILALLAAVLFRHPLGDAMS